MDLKTFATESEIELSEDVLTKIQEAFDADEEGLKDKRDELLAANRQLKKDLKKAKEDLEEAQGEVESLTGKLADTETERDEARKNQADPEAQQKLEEIYKKQADKEIEAATKDRDQWKEKAEALAEKERKHTIVAAFDAEFAKHHVIEEARKGVRLSMTDDADVEVDDDGHITIDGIGLDVHIKDWAGSDPAKLFIKAPANGGGGAAGGDKGGDKKVANPWDPKHPKAPALDERGQIYKEDPAKAARMAAEFGHKLT